MILTFALVAVVSFGVTVAATWLVMRNASWLGLIDMPNARSSHETATPRGGGLGIAAGVVVGVLVLRASGADSSPQLDALLLGTAGFVALGAFDDRHPIRPIYRLVIQFALATAVVIALGGVGQLPLPSPLDLSVGWFASPLTVIWLVGLTNFYNFMDGLDGLAAGQAVASCIGIAVAGWSIGANQFALVLAASAIGFLLFNRPPARIFLGDSGSTALGFAIAGLPLLAPAGHRPMAQFAVAVGLSLFLLDPMETLVRLGLGGHRIGTAHRAHAYQRLASERSRHAPTAAAVVAAGLVLAIAGGVSYREPSAAWPVFLLGISAYAVERYLAFRANVRQPGR